MDRLRPALHQWIERRYAAGDVLVSGRLDPPSGGLIVAASADAATMTTMLEADPFVVGGVARYVVHAFWPADSPLRSEAFELFERARADLLGGRPADPPASD